LIGISFPKVFLNDTDAKIETGVVLPVGLLGDAQCRE
jgi:hypothetical protein